MKNMCKKWVILCFIALATCVCSGCNIFKYFDKKVNVYREKDVVDKKISLRFYHEQRHVPYIKVSEYYNEFFKINLNKNVDERGYRYSISQSEFLLFNLNQKTISINGLNSFSNQPDFTPNNSKCFFAINGFESTEPVIKTISLDKYKIRIYADDNEIYAPLTFLSKLSGGTCLYNVAYNGKDVYVMDYGALISDFERTTDYYGEKYSKKMESIWLRNKDLAEYAYNELCFVFDNLRGETSQMVFGENNLKTSGLDDFLSNNYPIIKEYLLSTRKAKYYSGLLSLFYGLSDGGHTGLLDYYPIMLISLFNIVTGSEELAPLYEKVVELENEVNKIYNSCDYSRNNMLGTPGDNYYYLDQESNTAYIGFDSFVVDYSAWSNYYEGAGSVPVDTDSFAFIRDKLYKAKSASVKNVVLDLTTNTGGETVALAGLIGLFNHSRSELKYKDTFNDYIMKEKYLIDINLDGKFDGLDVDECDKFDFNIGVLTSKASFSCANLFPSMMKELGYMIIGQQSGGGSCAISIETTAEGVGYVRSSHLTFVDGNDMNIDSGVDVDYPIDMLDNEFIELYDANDFYNCSLMSHVLSDFYSDK